MKRTGLLIISIIIWSTLSCDRAIEDFKLETHEPKIVINGLAQSDSSLLFQIAKTAGRNAFSRDKFRVNPSELVLKRNNEIITTTRIDNGDFYEAKGVIVKPADKFELNVTVPGLEPVSTVNIVPDSVSFTILSSELRYERPENCIDCEKEIRLKLQLKLNDPADSNFYAVSVETQISNIIYKDKFSGGDTIQYTQPLEISSLDGIYEFYKSYDLYPNGDITEVASGTRLYFSDNLLDGLKNTINLTVSGGSFYVSELSKVKLTVNLYAYNKAMFSYLKSVAVYNNSVDFILGDPVFLKTNIRNGKGVFGGMTQTQRHIVIDASGFVNRAIQE